MGPKKSGRKPKNKVFMISSIISFIILLSIILSILYKNDYLSSASGKVDSQENLSGEKVDGKESSKGASSKLDPNDNIIETGGLPDNGENPGDEHNSKEASGYIEGQTPPTEPTYINGVLIANKKYPLPSSYAPGVVPEAAEAMGRMIAAAKLESFDLTAFSSYRSYEYQTQLYTNYVNRDGKAEADRYSARPGYSEHQTGLAFDVGEVGQEDLWLTEKFGETPAGKWLVKNAHKYGFILRYPKGKESITGFMYESWHFRYVGIDIAKDIHAKNVTLEEYLKIQ